jgi:hypothetical protein
MVIRLDTEVVKFYNIVKDFIKFSCINLTSIVNVCIYEMV